MMRYLTTLILLGLFLNSSQAQRLFSPGFIVKANDDTLGVEILETSDRIYEIATYRLNSSSQEIVVEAENINGYGFINGRKFQKISSSILNSAPKFYEIHVKGKATLYSLGSIFMIQKDGTYYMLERTYADVVGPDKIEVRRETYAFRKTLASLFQDCKESSGAIKRAVYAEGSLSRVVRKYNECFGGSMNIDNKSKEKFGVGIHAGVVTQTFDFFNTGGNGSSVPYLSNSKPTSTSITPAFFLKYNFNSKWAMSLGLGYLDTSLDFTSEYTLGNERHVSKIKYDGSNYYVDLLLRYSFSNAGLVPYVFAGPGYGRTYTQNSSRDDTIYRTIGQSTTVSSPFHSDPVFSIKNSFGFVLGGGVRFKTQTSLSPFLELKFSQLTADMEEFPVFSVRRVGVMVTVGAAIN